MRSKVFIPPVVALLAGGIWLGSQKRSLSTLEEEVLVLRKQISAASGSSGETGEPGMVSVAKAAAVGTQPIDWKKTAATIMEMHAGRSVDMRETMRLQRRLQEMSREELTEALAEIEGMDLPPAVRTALEEMLVGPLARKDPEMVLSKFASRLADDNHSMAGPLADAMSEWLKKDPGSALQWLDREIESGTFDAKALDGKNHTMLRFESLAIQTLLSSDPDSAAARAAAIPKDQRGELFRNMGPDRLKEEDHVAFAKLVRTSLSENERNSIIASPVPWMVGRGGLDAADAYLERIRASPGERAAVADESVTLRARYLSREKPLQPADVEELRRWSDTQSPEMTDRLTGKILGDATKPHIQNKLEQADAIARVEEYHRTTGNDDVLVGYLQSAGWDDKEAARKLAGKLTDPAKREEWMKRYR